METLVLLAFTFLLGVWLVFLFYNQAGRIIPSRLNLHEAPRSQEGLVRVHGSDACKDTEGVDVVLVHGLGSNPDTTWLAEAPVDSITSDTSSPSKDASTSRAKSYVNWITEFLVNDLDHAKQPTTRVFFYNYDSYWKRDALQTRLSIMADKLLSDLQSVRDSETGKRRRLLFVTHSYGGLVVKQALAQAVSTHLEIRDSTKAIVFLGCPHNGSNFAKWGVLTAQVLYPLGSNPGMLQGLVYNSQSLRDLHKSFVKNFPDTTVINFFEQRKVCFLKLGWFRLERLCVTEQSATWEGPTVENLGLTADHYGLNKFGFRSSAYMSISNKINSLIESMNPSRQDGYMSEKHRDCHRVFKNSTYEQFKNINHDRVEQTCQWALYNSLYRRWKDSATDDLLWISADPGCGKSVLSKALVDEELPSGANGSTVCYFFFKDNDEQNSLATCLCALLHQLFQHQPRLLRHAVTAWNKDGNKLQQETHELWRILLGATSDPAARNTVCVLDALDECKDADRSDLIAKLARFHTNAAAEGPRQSWLKFIITSRPYDDIQRGFEQIPSTLPAIRLRGEEENDQIREEINCVIHVRVRDLAKDLRLRESTFSRLVKTLLAMEHRTYLWLHLAIEDIRLTLRNSLRPDEEPIKSVPASVESAYEKILARVEPEQHLNVKCIFQIIVGARRPLAVDEMALALGLTSIKQYRTSAETQIDPVQLRERLKDWCGLFVFINQSKIYLIHQTAREFLIARQDYQLFKSLPRKTWRHCLHQVEVQQTMTSICIRCLNLEDRELLSSSETLPAGTPVAGESTKEFTDYCCEWWTTHYRLSQDEIKGDMFQDVLDLYNTERETFKFWFGRFWAKTWKDARVKSMPPVQLAALNNHEKVLEHFLDKTKINIEAKDELGRTALTWASGQGHDHIVQMLLDRSANVDSQQGENYSNPLQAASTGGHDKIVQMLLDKGATDLQGGGYGSALRAAAAKGHIHIVQVLLDKSPDNAQSERYGKAVNAASTKGHTKIVQMLLDRGADVNVRGGSYGWALQAAAHLGHAVIVKTLLDRGANVNARGGAHGSALQAAAYKGDVMTVKILLDRGADVNARGGMHGSALQAAAYKGHIMIVKLLLDRGADANAKSIGKVSALQAASERGWDDIVQVLVDEGAKRTVVADSQQ